MFNTADIGAKYFLNGFPKAGLHLVEGLMQPLAKEQKNLWPMTGETVVTSWVPVFKSNAWSLERERAELTFFALGRVREGHYLKGHMDCVQLYTKTMYWFGIIHIFIYRDPRDVAVSIAHELWYPKGKPGLSSKLGVAHPAKEEFRAMASFDDVLSAVIGGHGKYPGVITRWANYALWLGNDWSLILKFEDVVENPFLAADAIINHTMVRLTRVLDLKFNLEHGRYVKLAQAMVDSARDTDKSITFRSGRVGDWKECFTEKHVKEFKYSDPFNYLVQLGYEEDEDWTL